MKTLIKNIPFSLLTILLICSCTVREKSINEKFLSSTVVPEAEGTVQAKKDKNNNYKINVTIFNLAEPDKIEPAKKYYIVWIETNGNQVKNMGQIKTSKGKLTSALKASFETVTPFRPIKVIISAEDNIDAAQPGDQVILTTDRLI